MSLIQKVRQMFQRRPIEYHCVHSIAEALKISRRSATDCVNALIKEGFLKFTFKDICIHQRKRKHSFYEEKIEKTWLPKKAKATPKIKINPLTKTVIITDKSKNRVIYKKAKVVEIDSDIVHIVEV